MIEHKLQEVSRVAVVGRDVRFFESVTSTNDEARKLAEEGARDGTVVVAENQTAGRGRYGRKWSSLPESIAMTVILRPQNAVIHTACAMGTVAVCGAVQAQTMLNARISWPNDIVVNGRKIAGVLAEVTSCVLLGIGVNVNTPRSKFPSELKDTATSLSAELGRKTDRQSLLTGIIREIDALYATWATGQIDPLEEEWKSLSATLGQNIVVAEEGLAYEGRAIDAGIADGLILQLREGGTRTFSPDRATLAAAFEVG